MACNLCGFVLVFCALNNWITTAQNQPNIIFIVADDMGWNDVGFHGSNQIPTPNIDALAYNGVILNSHYVQSICTPSRSALLTGTYPMRIGMHGTPILPAEPRALPAGKIFPEYFKDIGYDTQIVGKWHLGASRWNDTPTFRGFDHHFGNLNGFVSYYDYLTTWTFGDRDVTGFDLRKDTVPAWEHVGKYVTDLYTEKAVEIIDSHDPRKPLLLMLTHVAPHAANAGKALEAPQDTVNKFKYVVDSNRRTYAAMISKLDDSVGTIVEVLESKNMLQNSIIVFVSDNGAPTIGTFRNWGSNYPLRGIKDTLFEGGVRDVAFIWSPLIVQNGRVSNDLVHVTDWLPTLLTAAGGDISLLDPDLDGIDQWSSLVYDLPSPRNDILINLDERTRNAALRFYNWKLIVGTTHNGSYNGYFGDSGQKNIEDVEYNTSAIGNSAAAKAMFKSGFSGVPEVVFTDLRQQATLKCLGPKAKKNPCDPATGAVCLYDIPSDPCEENDLAKYFPSVVRRMKRALVDYRASLVDQLNREPEIDKANPEFFHYTWNPWIDCKDETCTA